MKLRLEEQMILDAREAADLKAGETYTNPKSGMSFTVVKVRKNDVVVTVDRAYRDKKGDYKLVENERTIPNKRLKYFTAPYTDKD